MNKLKFRGDLQADGRSVTWRMTMNVRNARTFGYEAWLTDGNATIVSKRAAATRPSGDGPTWEWARDEVRQLWAA